MKNRDQNDRMRTQALRRARRRVRAHVANGVRLSDKLIAMRRAESRRG
jgi:hypothetical protein